MSLFVTVARRELSRQLRRPLLWLGVAALGLVAYQPLAYTGPGERGLVATGPLAHDAPVLVTLLLGRVTVAATLFILLLAGEAGRHDFEHGSATLVYSTPSRPSVYLGGRFLGAGAAGLLILVAAASASWIAVAGLPAAFRVPHGPLTLLQPFATHLLPNLAITAGILFGLAALTRSSTLPWIVTVAFVAIYLLLSGAAPGLDGASALFADLADPFGLVAVERATEFWSVAEREGRLAPVPATLVVNRLIWMGAAALTLALAVGRIRRTLEGSLEGTVKPEPPAPFRTAPRAPGSLMPARARRGSPSLRLLPHLTARECVRLVRHPAFLVLTALAGVQVFRNLTEATAADGTGSLPLSSALLPAASNLEEFVVGMTIFFAGLLAWKGRERSTGRLVETHPVPGWAFAGSKLVALGVGQTIMLAVGAALAIGVQLWRGNPSPDPLPYLVVLFGIQLPGFWHLAVVALIAQRLSPNRYVGYAASAGLAILGIAVLPALGIRSPLLIYGTVPEYAYSSMDGLAHFALPLAWHRVYWMLGTVPALYLLGRTWRRGAERSWWEAVIHRAEGARGRGRWMAVGAGAGAAIMAAVVLQSDLSRGGTPLTATELRGAYESRYGRFRHRPEPSLAGIDIDVAFHPADRRAIIEGRYRLVNRTNRPLDSLLVTLFPLRDVSVRRLGPDRPHETALRDDEVGVRVFRLAEPVPPEGSLGLGFSLEIDAPAIWSTDARNELGSGVSFLDNYVPGRYLPAVGYARRVELRDPAARREAGLPPWELPGPRDSAALDNPVVPSFVHFEATVSTAAGRTPLAPGERVEQWSRDGRTYSRFRADSLLGSLAFLAGRWELRRERLGAVEIELYHDPEHSANLDRILEGARASLRYSATRYAPYPHSALRIVEVPDHGHLGFNARSYPTLIVWSENAGWFDDYRSRRAFPYALSTAAHEVAHQWWPGLVAPAAARGFGVLGEGVPDHVRARTLEETGGEEMGRRWTERQRTGYLRGRGRTGDEHPLVQAVHPYVFRNKSHYAFRWLSANAGAASVDGPLRSMLTSHRLGGAPYATALELRDSLAVAVPDSLEAALVDWWDRIVLFDNRIVSVSSRLESGGRVRVALELEIGKFASDRRGELERMDDRNGELVEVALYADDGRELHHRSYRLRPGSSTLVVTVDEPPVRAVLDPRLLLLERRRSDNSAPVPPPEGGNGRTGPAGSGAP